MEEGQVTEVPALPEEEAPREVEQDAIAELERIHEEQYAKRPLGPGYFEDASPGAGWGNYGMSAPTADSLFDEPHVSRGRGDSSTIPATRELKSLEDLYDAYPEIGDGTTYLRVERKHPTRYGNQYVAGFIADLHEQITMSEFTAKFGGQVYEVHVRGPGRSSTLDSEGRMTTRTLNTITIKVPGVPKLEATTEPVGGGNGNYPRGGSMGYEDPRIALKRMDYEHEALKRSEQREEQLRREMRTKASLPPELMAQLHDLAEKRVQDTKNVTVDIITDLREDKRRLTEAVRARDEQIDKLRQRVVDIQTEVQGRLREEETRQVRELKLAQEQRITHLKEEHANTIQRMQQEHERRIAEMTERHGRESQSIRETEQRERERLRDDSTRREKNLQDDFSRREQMFRDRENSLKDDFARREEMVRRDYEMRFQQLERSNKRDVDMIRSSESTKSALSEQTAKMQTGLHMQEIQRLTHQLEEAERRAEETERDLRKFTNKPLLQQVEETKTIAETLGLFDKNKEEEMDWKKMAFAFGKDIINKLPDISKGVAEVREQNRVAVERARQQAEMAQARAAAAQRYVASQPQAAPPMAHRPVEQRRVAPPPPPPGVSATWDSGPPDPGAGSSLPPEPAGPPRYEPAPPSPLAGHVNEPAPPPFTGGPMPPREAPPKKPESPQAAVPLPATVASAPAAEPPPSPPTGDNGAAETHVPVQITEEQVARFGERLEQAIDLDVPAEMFADGFIAETSPATVLAIVTALGPDQLVDAVASQPGGDKTSIVTRQGRKYIRELWQVAHNKATALLQQQG